MFNKIAFLVLSTIIFIGCNEKHFYQENINLTDTWNQNKAVEFNFNIENTEDFYNMLLAVKHNENYSYNNLYVKIKTQFPDTTTAEDIISLNIGDKKGGFLGDCSGGDCKETIELQKNFKFKKAGQHKISIYQHSREENLKNVKAISLILDKVEK